MKDKRQIAINTEENSLIELHERIFALMQNQPPESRKLIEQLIDYYNKIILCMPGNVYWMDRECKTVGCNQNVLDMFGLADQKDFYKLSFDDMATIGNWSKNQGISFQQDTIEVIESGQPKANVEEPPIKDTQGNELYFLSTRVPLYNAKDEVIGIVGISTDISKLKRSEIALDKANKVKSEFLANLSHDLLTPLSSLTALTEELSNRIKDTQLRKLAFDAQSCAEQVMLLIDEILEITDIDMGKVPQQQQVFNFKHLILAVYNLMKTAAHQKALAINYEIDENIPDVFVGKRQLIHRVLMNLLSNAIKFTVKGSVNIKAELLERQSSKATVKIQVTDTGIGIPEDKYRQIFEQFERLSSAYEGEYVGRGLGLYIVKQFIGLLNAEIAIDSSENQGSTFTICLPLEIATETDKKYLVNEYQPQQRGIDAKNQLANDTQVNIDTASTNKQSAKILLVEDTEIARKVTTMCLQTLTQEIDHAITGREAVTKAKKNNYDLIILDIGLPDISGNEVAKEIRSYEENHGRSPIPIVALTAHIAQSNIQTCLNSGIQQVIKKPLSTTRARSLFENWLGDVYIQPETYKQETESAESMNEINAEILDKFLNNLSESRLEILNAFESNDMETLRNAVHFFHGATQFTRFESLKKACNSLESAIIDEFSNDEIKDLYADLLTEIDYVIESENLKLS